MKKFLPIIIAAVIIIAGGAVFFLTKSDKKEAGSNSEQSSSNEDKSSQFTARQACEIFTLEDAKKVLGDNATKTEVPGGGSAGSDDIEVSQCFYSQPSGDTIESIKATKQASILVRAPKTNTGAESNQEYFTGSAKPADVQDVSGYGDAASWNPGFGQLNILKNKTWYILSIGPAAPSEKTMDEAKKLADILIDKL